MLSQALQSDCLVDTYSSSLTIPISRTKFQKANKSQVLAWYHMHSLPVTPINPSTPTIKLSSASNASYQTVPSVSQLSDPSSTALSFLTPPAITSKVLAEAQKAGVKSIWLQPGSFDDRILEDAKGKFENVIGGYEEGTVGGEGWCVLVDGENVLDEIGRSWKQQRL